MSSNAHPAGLRLLPVMQYRDLDGAIDWLTKAFGFEEHHVVRVQDGTVQYAVVSYANALIMLGPVRGAERNGLMKQPDETGGAETQSCYFVVDDADAHYARAKAAGAAIVFDLKAYDYGGRGYTCRDPEGHIWTFGTYDPCQVPAGRSNARRAFPMVPTLVAVLIAIAAAGWLTAAGLIGAAIETPEARRPTADAVVSPQTTTASAELELERAKRKSAESRLGEVSKQAALERDARQRALRVRDEVASQASAERDARQRVEHARAELAKQISVEREARQRVERELSQLSRQAAVEHEARQHVERAAQEARTQSELQRGAREAAERRLQQLQQELVRERHTLKTLQEQLRAEGRAREDAVRAAQEAQKRLAELEATRASGPAQGSSPTPSAAQKEAPKPNPSRNVTREATEPMPPLIP